MDRFLSSDPTGSMDWEWDQLTASHRLLLHSLPLPIHPLTVLFIFQQTSIQNPLNSSLSSLPVTKLPLLDPLLRVHSPRIIRRRQHLPLRVRRRIHNLPIGLLAHSLRELLHRRRRRQRDLRAHLQTLHLRETGRMRGRKHLFRLGISDEHAERTTQGSSFCTDESSA